MDSEKEKEKGKKKVGKRRYSYSEKNDIVDAIFGSTHNGDTGDKDSLSLSYSFSSDDNDNIQDNVRNRNFNAFKEEEYNDDDMIINENNNNKDNDNINDNGINLHELDYEDIYPEVESSKNITFASSSTSRKVNAVNNDFHNVRREKRNRQNEDQQNLSFDRNGISLDPHFRMKDELCERNGKNFYYRSLESHNFEQEESEIWRVYDMKRRRKFGGDFTTFYDSVGHDESSDFFVDEEENIEDSNDDEGEEEEGVGGSSQSRERRDSSGGLLLHHRYFNSTKITSKNRNGGINDENIELDLEKGGKELVQPHGRRKKRRKRNYSRSKWDYYCHFIWYYIKFYIRCFYQNICLCRFYSRYMTKNKERALKRWILTLIIALGIQLVAVCIIYLTTTIVSFKYWTITSCLDRIRFKGDNSSLGERIGNILLGFFLYVLICMFFSIIAFTMCYLEPSIIGSGIPETKSYLNGIDLPNILEGKTLICKALGIACSIVSGLPVGKEGPLIQIGAIVGATVTRGFCKCQTKEKENSEEGETSNSNTSMIIPSEHSTELSTKDPISLGYGQENRKGKTDKRLSKVTTAENSMKSPLSLREEIEGENGIELQIREQKEYPNGKVHSNKKEVVSEKEKENEVENENDTSALSMEIPSFSSTSSSPRKENLLSSTLALSQNFTDYLYDVGNKTSTSLSFSPSSSPPRHHLLRSSDPTITNPPSSLSGKKSSSNNNFETTQGLAGEAAFEKSNIPVYYLEQNTVSYNDRPDTTSWSARICQTIQSLFSLEDFRNHKEIREFVVCGAAAGVTAAFGAPLGGMLFAMEEGASYWSLKLSWRVFACSVATAIVGLILVDIIRFSPLSAIVDPKAVIAQLNYFGFFPPGMLWTFQDMLIFALMGVFGGVLGALFNSCNLFITRLRKNHWYPKYRHKEKNVVGQNDLDNCVVLENTQSKIETMQPLSDGNKEFLSVSPSFKSDENLSSQIKTLPSKISAMVTDWKKNYRFQFWEVLILTSIMASLCYCIPLMNRDVCQPYPAVIPLATKTEEVTNLLVPFTCYKSSNVTTSQEKDSFNSIASLYFTSWDDSLRLLIHMPMYSVVELDVKDGETVVGKISNRPLFTVADLLLFVLPYFVMTFLTFGIMVPSGLFIPSLVSGAAFGRIIGQLLHTSYGANKFADPGVYALMGASALLGGITRIYISLSVILLETTGNLYFLFPFMVVLMTARFVGNLINDGIYDMHIHLRKYPFLEPWCPLEAKVNDLRASDVMASPVITIRPIECVARLVQMLEKCNHHAFPLLEKHGGIFGIINRDTLCVLLHLQAFSVSCPSTFYKGLKHGIPSKDEENTMTIKESSGKGKASIEFHKNYKDGGLTVDFDSPLPQSPIIPYEWIEAYFPNYPTIDQIKPKLFQSFSSSDILGTLEQCYIDLRPYCNTAPYFISESCTLPRTYRLFRTMGMRHLLVMSNINSNELVGIITRHDLIEDNLSEIIREKQKSINITSRIGEETSIDKEKNYYKYNWYDNNNNDNGKVNVNISGILASNKVGGNVKLSRQSVVLSDGKESITFEDNERESSQEDPSEIPSSQAFQRSGRRRSSLLEGIFNRVSQYSTRQRKGTIEADSDSTLHGNSNYRSRNRVWKLDMNKLTRFQAVGIDNMSAINNLRSSISTFSPPRLLHFRPSTKTMEVREREVWIERVKDDWEDVNIDQDIGDLQLENYSKMNRNPRIIKQPSPGEIPRSSRSRSRSTSPKSSPKKSGKINRKN